MVSSASSANIIKKKDVKTTFTIYLSNRSIEINFKKTNRKISNFVKKQQQTNKK